MGQFADFLATPFSRILTEKTRRFLCSLVDFLTVYPSQLIKRSPNVYENERRPHIFCCRRADSYYSVDLVWTSIYHTLKGLSYEIDFENVDVN
jgi:hypothetical protein